MKRTYVLQLCLKRSDKINNFSIKTYKKNEYLVNPGDLNPMFGFILEGLAKVAINTFDGKEFNVLIKFNVIESPQGKAARGHDRLPQEL